MEVGHLLVAVFALVREDATATLGNAKLLCHFADRTHEPGQLRVARLLSEIGIGDIRSLRDNENMDRRLRINVLERERLVVFINLIAGNFASQNFGENILVVVTHRLNPFPSNSSH